MSRAVEGGGGDNLRSPTAMSCGFENGMEPIDGSYLSTFDRLRSQQGCGMQPSSPSLKDGEGAGATNVDQDPLP